MTEARQKVGKSWPKSIIRLATLTSMYMVLYTSTMKVGGEMSQVRNKLRVQSRTRLRQRYRNRLGLEDEM